MDLYKYYPKKNWTYKSNSSKKKKINVLMSLLSLTLASVCVITGVISKSAFITKGIGNEFLKFLNSTSVPGLAIFGIAKSLLVEQNLICF